MNDKENTTPVGVNAEDLPEYMRMILRKHVHGLSFTSQEKTIIVQNFQTYVNQHTPDDHKHLTFQEKIKFLPAEEYKLGVGEIVAEVSERSVPAGSFYETEYETNVNTNFTILFDAATKRAAFKIPVDHSRLSLNDRYVNGEFIPSQLNLLTAAWVVHRHSYNLNVAVFQEYERLRSQHVDNAVRAHIGLPPYNPDASKETQAAERILLQAWRKAASWATQQKNTDGYAKAAKSLERYNKEPEPLTGTRTQKQQDEAAVNNVLITKKLR